MEGGEISFRIGQAAIDVDFQVVIARPGNQPDAQQAIRASGIGRVGGELVGV